MTAPAPVPAHVPGHRRVLGASLFTVAMIAASIPMWAIYQTPQVFVLVAVSLLVGAGLATIGWRRSLGATTMILLSVGLFVALMVPIAVPSALRGGDGFVQGLLAGLAATWTGWRDLLTIPVPVGSYQALLVPPFMLMLFGTVIGLTLVLRSRVGELAAIVPGIVAAWGVLWGPREGFYPIGVGILVTASIVAFIAVQRTPRVVRSTGTKISRGRTLAGIAAGLVACLVGGVVGELVPFDDRVVLRLDEPPELVLSAQVSPLTEFRSYLLDEHVDAVQMTMTGLVPGDRVRLGVLDTYDGVVAYAAGTLTPTAGRVDANATSARRIGVTIDEYLGSWVPSPGPIEGVTFIGPRSPILQAELYAQTSSGAAFVEGGLLTGDQYDLVVAQTPAFVVDATELTPEGEPSFTQQELPQSMLDRLATWVQNETTPGGRLTAMLQGFQTDGYISHGGVDEPPSRGGHSLARITELFQGLMIGDAEQYSVAAALMAHQLGFQTRVVVGFAPHVASDVPTAVFGGDITAWIEVSTTDGWVALDPTPEWRPVPEDDEPQPQPITQPDQPNAPNLPQAESQTGSTDAEPAELPPVPESSPLRAIALWIAAGLGALLLLASPVLVIMAVKAVRRRRRRRSGGVASRVVGAWSEWVDSRVDRGLAAPGTLTRLEYAGDDDEARAFAALVDHAAFGRDAPDPGVADRAWALSDRLTAESRAGSTRAERIRERLSVQSFPKRWVRVPR